MVSCDALDNGETVGAEAIQDMKSSGMEDLVNAMGLKTFKRT